MTVLTVALQRDYARLLVGDRSTTNPGAQDSEYNASLAEAYEFLANMFGPRITMLTQGDDAGLVLVLLSEPYRMDTLTFDIEEIFSVHYEAGDSTTLHGPMLERVEFADIMRMRARSTSVGTPKYVAYAKQGASAPISGAGASWHLNVHPPTALAGNTYFSMRVRCEPVRYTISGTYPTFVNGSIPNLLALETRIAARLAAYDIASYIGRGPDKLDAIAKLIPEGIRAAKGIKLHAGVGIASVDLQ